MDMLTSSNQPTLYITHPKNSVLQAKFLSKPHPMPPRKLPFDAVSNMVDEENKAYALTYRIIRSERKGSVLYGFEVSKYDEWCGCLKLVATEKTEYVTDNYERAAKIIKILSLHSVTPINLVDVVDDCLDAFDDVDVP